VCGYYLAQGGAKVALLDKEHFPRDKICGDAVCTPAIHILEVRRRGRPPASTWLRPPLLSLARLAPAWACRVLSLDPTAVSISWHAHNLPPSPWQSDVPTLHPTCGRTWA
jgi:hypothetical protein